MPKFWRQKAQVLMGIHDRGGKRQYSLYVLLGVRSNVHESYRLSPSNFGNDE